jgi:hypothetical protein
LGEHRLKMPPHAVIGAPQTQRVKAVCMGIPRTAKAGLDSTLGLIAKRLRGESDEATREALPERWVELIKYLDEQGEGERSRPTRRVQTP